MTLYEFLQKNRALIIAASEKKSIDLAALRPNSKELQNGLPIFFDQLTEVLSKRQADVCNADEIEISDSASLHGKELMRLGYTLSHVVHSYGAMCQAITEIASQTKAPITADEFHNLNRCLDIAIAGAVTEFETLHHADNKSKEVLHLGAIAHELRNALNRAQISYHMLVKGTVGVGGSTSKVLGRSLDDLERLISRSLSEVRLRADSDLDVEYFAVYEAINQLMVTAEIEAELKSQKLIVEVDEQIGVKTDLHLVLSALGNLIQNALKYTKQGGHIHITGKKEDAWIVIEVRDQCGGIPPGKIEDLFRPFEQQSKDKTGLGLGLVISKKAIEKCGGTLRVHNTEDGCVFTAKLPFAEAPAPGTPQSVV
jgi:signal transduction histidine kinase